MDEELIKKKPFLKSFLGFIDKLFKKEEKEYDFTVYSKFRDYVSDMDKEDPMFENAMLASDLCEDALDIAKQRIVLSNKIKVLDEKIEELDCYLKLNEEEASKLKNLLDSFISLTKERDGLIFQLTSFDKSLSRMMNLETDAVSAVEHIQDAEKNQRILKQDIGYLEGEKAELIDERALLEKGLIFIERFTIMSVALFCFVSIYLGYLFMFKEVSIFFPTTVLVLLTIVVVTLLNVFKRRIRFELKMNIKKQKKAVEILNTKNVVYVYYTNFLNFEYKKYRVRSAQMLKTNLKDYKNYKHITLRIDAIRKVMYETEKELARFLREKNLNYEKFTVEQFAHTINVDDKMDYSRELIYEKSVLEKNLSELDARHEIVWDKLEDINNNDTSPDKIINQLIQLYFDEVTKLLSSTEEDDIDKEGEAV